jgi:hypothetical protein
MRRLREHTPRHPPLRAARGSVAAALALALAAAALVSCARSSPRTSTSQASAPATQSAPASGYAWLRPAPAPIGWRSATTASGQATLFYPAGWKPLRGDAGTVTAALRGADGRYAGYLNATPRQGTERPRGWARFRVEHLVGEGATHVHQTTAAEGLRFSGARGSCVTDDYLSRVGANHYREIACIVAGEHATSVFIAAALVRDWRALAPLIERASSAFRER